VGRRLAVLADIGAEEAVVAGVARPHPVADVAAVGADALRRRVDDAYVADLEVAEQAIGVAAGEAVEAATETGLGYAFGNELLAQLLQRGRAARRILGGANGGTGLRGDVLDRVEHVDARVRTTRQFLPHGGGIEAGLDQVLLRRGIQLQA